MRSLQVTFFKWFFKVWGPWKFPHSIPTGYCHVAWKEPSAARRVSYLLFTTLFWGIFFFFLVVYKGSKPSKLIYCVGSYHLLRVGKRLTAPLNIRFQRETRTVMSLLSPLSSVHNVHTFLNTEYAAKDMYIRYFLKVFTEVLFVEKLTCVAIQQKSLWFSCFYRYSLLFSVAGV